MILEIYAVHDAAVGCFNQPLFFRSRGEAVRSFQGAVADENSQFARHAKDYSLWFVGTYDDSLASFEAPSKPDRVCGALDFAVQPV